MVLLSVEFNCETETLSLLQKQTSLRTYVKFNRHVFIVVIFRMYKMSAVNSQIKSCCASVPHFVHKNNEFGLSKIVTKISSQQQKTQNKIQN